VLPLAGGAARGRANTLRHKSFLVLFFKKEQHFFFEKKKQKTLMFFGRRRWRELALDFQ
jgi:hypothetical protein